jgi:hypothetical protein
VSVNGPLELELLPEPEIVVPVKVAVKMVPPKVASPEIVSELPVTTPCTKLPVSTIPTPLEQKLGPEIIPVTVSVYVPVTEVPVCVKFHVRASLKTQESWVTVQGPAHVPVSEPPPLLDVLNVAVTDMFEFMVTVQVPVPEQAPDQPANVEPVFGVAVNVTTVPAA